ncbi:prepilin-type cleavage/methylation N-terminal domain protein [Bordetella bronchiseptica MBORD635]|uniref:type II secretion system protein n=1 Tax=Bordetella bronchiseptica TaxID=518 RepID=UPI000460BEEC|nr:prepilin-type N-terminal cleavage/methylation domain-containing protein [Bordetella bronchiseptica]KDC79652.1 prepilin-type cleavage/methylation N-terminal domain protein [Bordetella bronchiseptica MBORD635]
MNAPQRSRQLQAGFTLVEMAVVLVIIGIILGAVMIGRDAQRNAEYTRIRQNFVNQWALAYNNYVQRTGVPPGDDQRAPRLMVNGAKFTGSNGSLSGGDMSRISNLPSAICNSGTAPGIDRPVDGDVQLREVMLRAGITLPQGRGQGYEDRYVYLDTNGNPQEIQVCFQWNPPGTHSGSGNVMILTGLTPDLARSLSSAIDGNGDASGGSFRQNSVASGAGSQPGVEWKGNNTQTYGSTGDAEKVETGNAEGQVLTLIAHYKMNQ